MHEQAVCTGASHRAEREPALAAGQGESGNPPATDKERFIASLMARMSNAEKIGQLRLVSVGADHPKEALMADIRAGKVGAIFNTVTRPDIRAMQDQVRHSRLKIPLFHAYDVAHGHRTIFPISLGLAASWDPEVVARSARISALEASADGLDMSFSPMVDITRDARWGRVSEGFGEDTYLTSLLSGVMVRAYQAPIWPPRTASWRRSSTSPCTARPKAAATTTPWT